MRIPSHFASPVLLVLYALLALPFFASSSVAAPEKIPPGATEKEIRIGDEVAKELENNPDFKLLDISDEKNKAQHDKINAMVEALGKASTRPDINYNAKIVDAKGVNAFTLPNGRIYVYQGLIDFASSDDELAAVLSHEIAHNAEMHAIRGQAKASKLSWAGLAAMAIGLVGGAGGANVAMFSRYLLTGIMNSYTVKYEKEADSAAITQMAKTKYNPSALVTFMQRLADEENRRPEIQMGIFRTHPPSPERADAALSKLKELGISYTPRAVTGAAEAVVVEEEDRVLVKYQKDTLIVFAPGDDAKARAETTAANVNQLLRDGIKVFELRATGTDLSARLLGRDTEIAHITPADAKLLDTTPTQAAQTFLANFRKLFWRESVNGTM